MFLLVTFLNLIERSLHFDLPNLVSEFEQPAVAFQQRKLSKYLDLDTSEWTDSDEGYKASYQHILQFCQSSYPDRGITQVHQGGSLKTLPFCNVKDKAKCAYKETVTWSCMSREDIFSSPASVSPTSPSNHQIQTIGCNNETTESLSYDTCISIQDVVRTDHCSVRNQTLYRMRNLVHCEIDNPEGMIIRGLLSADLQCCTKPTGVEEDEFDDPFLRPDFATPTGRPQDAENWFRPSGAVAFPPDPTPLPDQNLPQEWCGLQEVERKRENMTDENLKVMKDIYSKTEQSRGLVDINMEEVVVEIKAVEKQLNVKVVTLYTQHFNCLGDTVKEILVSCGLLLQRLRLSPDDSETFAATLNLVSLSLTEANTTFSGMCKRQLDGAANDFSTEYRSVVIRLQELRLQIETVKEELDGLENCAGCRSAAPPTQPAVPTVPIPNNTGDQYKTDDVPKDDTESSKPGGQKYLTAAVSAVSCLTILAALIFFILVVRRTLQRDSTRAYTDIPRADILSDEQYVEFLQKNGYANPTCRLTQKYLDHND